MNSIGIDRSGVGNRNNSGDRTRNENKIKKM